ncbi:MAG: serine/threonine-protein kinase [Minicystis sp.]
MQVPTLHAGDVFAGQYRVLRPLAEGEPVRTYLVEQIGKDRQRRLDLFDTQSDPERQQRFIAASRITDTFESPFVDAVLDAGVTGDTPWIVTEHLEGEPLAAHVARRGYLPADEAWSLVSKLLDVLARAHERGIVHGELSPDQVFFIASPEDSATPSLRLRGFGIARLLLQWESEALVQVKIPPSYPWMSPDRLSRGSAAHLTPSDDLWSLGLLAFWMLTGRSFWRGTTPVAIIREAIADPIPLASARAAELGVEARIPPAFDAWFARCVTRDKEARFADASAAEQVLPEGFRFPGPVVLANPKGSHYDDGIQDSGPFIPGDYRTPGNQSTPDNLRTVVHRTPEILGNPKGSFYDAGHRHRGSRWRLVLSIAFLAVVLLAVAGVSWLRFMHR